jgi:ankyrin repeat protein
MARIEGQIPSHKELAMQVLSWISYAARPLQLREMQHALAVQIGDRHFDDEGIEPANLLVSVCAGLVTIDDQPRTMRLVHYTVEEYFENTKKNKFPNARRQIAETLLTYLSFDVFANGPCLNEKEYGNRVKKFPLFEYAAQYWAYYTSGLDDSGIRNLAVGFLVCDLNAESASEALCGAGRSVWPHKQDTPTRMHGIHLASYFGGLEDLVGMLISAGVDPNSRDGNNQTPLAFAARKGLNEIVKLLLATRRTDLNLSDTDGKTPLSLAAEEGYTEIVRLLLTIPDIQVDSQDSLGRTPLSQAILKGHTEIVNLLLNTAGTRPDRSDRYSWTPLLAAIGADNIDAVKSLVISGVDLHRKDLTGRTPLLWAISGGNVHVVKALLEAGADANINDDYHDTPLLYAVRRGDIEVIKLLLAWGAKPLKDAKRLQEALTEASRRGDDATVKLFNRVKI